MNTTLYLTASTLLLAVSNLSAATLYVSLESTNPAPPYTNWVTAATSIQDAVDGAAAGDEIVVANGVYQTGARAMYGMSNRVAVTKAVTVRSVNGPAVTHIRGHQEPGTRNGPAAVRCVYLANGAVLAGFTLTNGATQTSSDYGGGVWCEGLTAVVSNCVLTGNAARNGGGAYGGTLNYCQLTGNSAVDGGGACNCTLNNCLLTDNSAYAGGGTCEGVLNNCTLTGNSADYGGGAYWGTLNNSIFYYNNVRYNGANCDVDLGGTINYCCTTPLPTNGVGNISLPPQFVDYAKGNLRLQYNSPCINAGCNSSITNYYYDYWCDCNIWFTNLFDLDGRPRIVGGTVDIGAYEFQPGASGLFIGWLQQYGLPTDGSADFIDSDYDGLNNWQEWVCGTCPTNCLSALCMLSAMPYGTNVTVSWQSVAGVSYFLECSTNLLVLPCFRCVGTNILGQTGATSYADTNAIGEGPFFYRVGVQP